MAIWKEAPTNKKDGTTDPLMRTEPATRPEVPRDPEPVRSLSPRDGRESLIAPEITVEGKIEGTGHVRIAGRFKGDVHVQGNVAVDPGAKVTGGVRGGTVTIAGEVDGNIESASRVELLESAVLNGDLKAESLVVAAGSRMRGQVEFGWTDAAPRAIGSRTAGSSAA